MPEQIIFAVFAFLLVGFSYYQYHTLRNALSATVLMVMTCAVLAFYMLQFGTLGSFTMKGLSAEASFIRDKSIEVQASARRISEIQSQVEKDREAIADVAKAVVDSDNKVKRAESLVKDAQIKVDQIQQILNQAQTKLAEVQELSNLNLLLAKLSNSDRQAFDQLLAVSKEKNNPLSAFVSDVLHNASDNEQIIGFFPAPVDWNGNHLDPSSASFEQLADLFIRSSPRSQLNVLQTIWEQQKFAKRIKLQFLADTIQQTKNLRILYYAMIQLNAEANLNKTILDYPVYLDWWEKHKTEYPDK